MFRLEGAVDGDGHYSIRANTLSYSQSQTSHRMASHRMAWHGISQSAVSQLVRKRMCNGYLRCCYALLGVQIGGGLVHLKGRGQGQEGKD